MEGVQGKVAEALAPAGKAGEEAGEKTGKGWSTKAKAAMVAGSAVLVAGVVAGFKGLYEIGDTFDAVTETIRVGTGAQGKALDGLVESAKTVGSQVPAEFDKIGPTIADLNTRLGLSGKTLETVASQYLEAGRILEQDVDINKTTAAFSAFGIEGDEVIGAMDTLFQVSQATGLGMNELAQTVQTAAPALQNLGFSFEESAALAGTLDKAGLNTTQVMASMSKGLVTLAKDGEEPQEAFKRVTQELQGFVDTGDTASALDLASKVFGTRGASQFVGALQSGKLNLEDLMGSVGATGDTILGVGQETMDFAEKAQILGNQAQIALEPLATAVFTAMGDALTFVMPLMESFGAWLKENQGVMIAAAAVIGTVLVGAMIAWTASVVANTVAWLASPVTWIILAIIAAIGLLVAAIVWLVQNWDAVIAFFQDVWANVVAWFNSTLEAIGSWWTSLWTEVGNFFRGIWSAIASWWQGLWNGISSWWNGLIAGIASFLLSTLNNINSFWKSVWNGIVSFFTGLWNGVVSFVSGVFNGIRNTIAGVLNGISATWNNIWQGMVDFLSSAFSGIVGVVKAPINGIISLINGAIGALNGISVTIPDWVPIVGGQTWGLSLPKIPMLAKGGTITASGYTIVGEQGPELLKLPKGAQVNPDYDDVPDDRGVTFNNYAPLGQTPAQALTEFSNRAKGL